MNEKTGESTGLLWVAKHPRTAIGMAFLLVCLVTYAVYSPTSETKITRLAKDEILVLRTPGV